MTVRRKVSTQPTRPRRRPNASPRRNELLEVKVRRSTARRARNRRISTFIVRIVLLISLGTATYFGMSTIVDKFFLTNPEYNLRHVRVDLGGLLSTDEVLDLTGIKPGTNIFRLDLETASAKLREIDQLSSVRIERNWPDQVVIQGEKREPVAWLARTGTGAISQDNAILVDADGRTFRPFRVLDDYWSLPVIFAPNPDFISSGDLLAGADLAAALALIAENASRPQSLLKIRSLDISRGYAIEVTNDAHAQIVFRPTEPAEQLDRLQRLLEHCAETGRQLESVNLIPTKYSPVRFAMATAPVPRATLPE